MKHEVYLKYILNIWNLNIICDLNRFIIVFWFYSYKYQSFINNSRMTILNLAYILLNADREIITRRQKRLKRNYTRCVYKDYFLRDIFVTKQQQWIKQNLSMSRCIIQRMRKFFDVYLSKMVVPRGTNIVLPCGNIWHGLWFATELICPPQNAGKSNHRDKYVSLNCTGRFEELDTWRGPYKIQIDVCKIARS